MIKEKGCLEYADALPLERIFGNPASKVLDFLILNQRFDYSESDISRLSEVTSRTLQRILPCLLAEKLVIRTRKSGKAFMYNANMESKRIQALQQYVKATIEENLTIQQKIKNNEKKKKENEELFEF